ncbi:EDS1, EP domain [Dillenia turbinata]|uniref:EDS1, EP domain n=1 Tax=Dillenia turbinata TaxID=194707 RepID=A0AAN8V4T2_9MAGN
MAERGIVEAIGVSEELIKEACSLSMKTHKSSYGKPYIVDKSSASLDTVLISFAATWVVNDWYAHKPFGQTKIDPTLFPSARSISNDEKAVVNVAFQRRFKEILQTSSLKDKVSDAMKQMKKIVFTGHSAGGPIATFATLWFLESYIRLEKYHIPPLCVTFGAPLTSNWIFSHALGRENWSRFYIHFVMRYDIVPRVLLTPLSSIEQLQKILHFLNPGAKNRLPEKRKHGSRNSMDVSAEAAHDAPDFFLTVMRSAFCVTNYAACNQMECANQILESVTSFVELSPYRAFGTYVFCSGNGKLVVVKNPDAVLQLLFYASQISSEAELAEVAQRSLLEHLGYEKELQESLQMTDMVELNNLEGIPLTSDGATDDESATINAALNDLGLEEVLFQRIVDIPYNVEMQSTRARICLRAAGALEKRKIGNQIKIDNHRQNIKDLLNRIEEYRERCETHKVGYYDAFRRQKDAEDFESNVRRLELAGMWDELNEMLKKYQLPDGFENRKEWIELGTMYRRLVEPLDIANYYRHYKNEDTGPYMIKGRPRRYRYTQRWREHAEKMPGGTISESCFWAEVEELCAELSSNQTAFEKVKERVQHVEQGMLKWLRGKEVGLDVLLEDSTFAKWWRMLPLHFTSRSELANYLREKQSS